MANQYFQKGTFCPHDATHDLDPSEYSTVVDVGDYASPGDDIASVIANQIGDDTLVEIPEGTWEWHGDVSPGALSNAAVVGAGQRGEVVIEPHQLPEDYILTFTWGSNHCDVGNFTVDQSHSSTNNVGNFRIFSDDGDGENRFFNILIEGDETQAFDSDNHGDGYKFRNTAWGSNANNYCENIEIHDYTVVGGDGVSYTRYTGGFRLGSSHNGTTHFENVYVEGRSNNSWYTARTNGKTIFNNCMSVNSMNHFRFGGNGDLGGDEMYNCKVVTDVSIMPSWAQPANTSGSVNMRGIRVSSNSRDVPYNGGLVEGCDILIEDATGLSTLSHHGIHIHRRWGGGTTIRDTRITTNHDGVPGIAMHDFDPGDASSGTTHQPVEIENVHVTGSASSQAMDIRREDSTVDGCCIYLPASGSDGVSANVSGVSVTNSNVNVSGTAFSNVSTSNNTTTGTDCTEADIDTEDEPEPPEPGENYGVFFRPNPNTDGDDLRLGSIEIHDEHPFD